MRRIALISVLCAFVSAPAIAGLYTPVSPTGAGSEASLSQILDVVTNGVITNVTDSSRVFDQATNPGEVWDEFWRDGTVDVTATALWWGNTANEGSSASQRFIYDDNIDGSSPDYTLGDAAWDSGESDSFSIGSSDPFIMGASNSTRSWDSWTRQSLNVDPVGRDRVVTFDVTGLDIYSWDSGAYGSAATTLLSSTTGSRYILGIDTGSDTDFQDFVVLVEGPNPVPVPGAVLLGMLGLSVVGVKLRKRA